MTGSGPGKKGETRISPHPANNREARKPPSQAWELNVKNRADGKRKRRESNAFERAARAQGYTAKRHSCQLREANREQRTPQGNMM